MEQEAGLLKEGEKFKDIQEKNQKIPVITRNKDGLAVIIMSNNIECIVDANIWLDVSKYSWRCFIQKGKPTYPRGIVDGKNVALHRYIYMKYVGPIPDGMTVDHKKSDQILDARLSNLRLANQSLQNHNKNILKGRIEKYKGI